jgi:flagellar protein FliO/FliZ
MSTLGAEFATHLAILAAVLVSLVLAARLFARWKLSRTGSISKQLAVREVIALDSRRRLHLVRCGDRDVVLLTGGQTDVVVGWLPNQEPPP